MKVTVQMRTFAHYMAEVELDADELVALSILLGKTTDELDEDDVRELAEDKAFQKGVPGLCHMEVISLNDWETPDKTEDAIEIIEQ